jgi:OOP family OmpA-OmpF porin
MKVSKSRLQRFGTGAPGKFSLLALALLTSQFALTADDGWYAGLSAGQSRADVDDEKIIARLLSDGFNSATLTEFEEDTGYKIFLGNQLSRNFAIEGGYFTMGEFGYMAEMDPVATMRGDARMMGLNLDLVGIIPMSEQFSVFGKIGAIYSQTRDQFSGHGPVIIDTFQTREREFNYKYGVGMQYDFTNNLGLRVEAERYRIDDAIGSKGDIDLFSVGVVYRFGKAAPVAAAPAAAPVVAAAPAPPPPPPPAPPPPTRVTLSADSLFDFNSAVVKPAGRAELDDMAEDLRGVDYDTITVTGHTDRIGREAYNLDLSMRRAQAVKDYLMQSANIASGKITTRGIDGREPVTTMAQCGNQLPRAQLIVCLAPDRRVEVEVSGTRPR